MNVYQGTLIIIYKLLDNHKLNENYLREKLFLFGYRARKYDF